MTEPESDWTGGIRFCTSFLTLSSSIFLTHRQRQALRRLSGKPGRTFSREEGSCRLHDTAEKKRPQLKGAKTKRDRYRGLLREDRQGLGSLIVGGSYRRRKGMPEETLEYSSGRIQQQIDGIGYSKAQIYPLVPLPPSCLRRRRNRRTASDGGVHGTSKQSFCSSVACRLRFPGCTSAHTRKLAALSTKS